MPTAALRLLLLVADAAVHAVTTSSNALAIAEMMGGTTLVDSRNR